MRQSSLVSSHARQTECLTTHVAGRKPGPSVMQTRHNTACVLGKGGVCRRAEGEGRCYLLQSWVVTLVNLPPKHGSDVALCRPARTRAMLGRQHAQQGHIAGAAIWRAEGEPSPLLPPV
jgi:hypothetical protein